MAESDGNLLLIGYITSLANSLPSKQEICAAPTVSDGLRKYLFALTVFKLCEVGLLEF